MELKTAQELIKTNNSSVMAGFNMFIHGHRPITFSDGYYDAGDRIQGYEFAEKMAKEDGIAFTKVFKCREGNCHPFQYGGFFVCNDCGNKGVDKDWWQIQVEKDGNEFCCHGLGFVNLQESESYAFGKTFDEAIYNYGTAMLRVSANGSQRGGFTQPPEQTLKYCTVSGGLRKTYCWANTGIKNLNCQNIN